MKSVHNRASSGFSLLEVLIVATIVAILAAILYPVYRSSVKQANKVSCQEKLHQIWLAIDLYRSQYGGTGVIGGAFAMGLPPDLVVLKHAANLPQEIFKCSGSTERSAGPAFTYMASVWQLWENFVRQKGEGTILILDDNHQDRPELERAPAATHYAFGYSVGGALLKRSRLGLPATYEFWLDGEE